MGNWHISFKAFFKFKKILPAQEGTDAIQGFFFGILSPNYRNNYGSHPIFTSTYYTWEKWEVQRWELQLLQEELQADRSLSRPKHEKLYMKFSFFTFKIFLTQTCMHFLIQWKKRTVFAQCKLFLKRNQNKKGNGNYSYFLLAILNL